MTLTSIFPSVQKQLERWSGYETLTGALKHHAGLNVFLAGGVVRNLLLGNSACKDFDFFLSGPSTAAAIEFFARRGELRTTPYGAPRWYPTQHSEQYADLMPIEEFVPGLWRCRNIVDILNQFDFTANAVAFDLRSGEPFDPQNGVRDVEHRTMKMVRFDYPEGPYIPGAGLSRNAVLWFRVLHYAQVLGLAIEPLTLTWLEQHRVFGAHVETFSRIFFRPHPAYLSPLNG